MLRSVVAIGVWLVSVQAMAESESFPYTAYVALESSSIRSGPDDSFYATDRLQRGAAVEVYRHEGGRWAAIRPPADSFSWLPDDAVDLVDQEKWLGRVTKTGTRTRVGSNLNSDHRGVAYITVNAGESVQIIEHLPEGDQGWYRISPPAGEFRWIRLADLSRSPSHSESHEPELVLIDPQTGIAPVADTLVEAAQYVTDSGSAPSPNTPPLDIGSIPEGPASAVNQDTAMGGTLPSPAGVPAATIGVAPGQLTTPLPRYSEAELQGQVDLGGTGLPPQPTTMIQPGPVAKHLLKSELADIELQLALTVSQPPVAWDTAPLRIRAQAVIDSSDDPDMRQQATQVLSKIAQFADLQRRQLSVDTEAAQLAMVQTGPSVLATTYGQGYYTGDVMATNLPGSSYPGTGLATQYNYDGTGWLMPVVTDREDMPRFVLTDSQGEIIQFVSASPGLNLQPYVGKQIGIVGKKDQLPEIGQPHIVADRIIALDKVRR